MTSQEKSGWQTFPSLRFHGTGGGDAVKLNSERAVLLNIEIMRAFVKLRQMLGSNAELSRRLDELESKYDRRS